MGLEEHLPWRTPEEALDYRLEPLGMTFREFCANHDMRLAPVHYRSYRRVGFGTPSGKVELWSSVLDELGFDPLPYAEREGLASAHGRITAMVEVRDDMQRGHLRVAHGWWFPELLGESTPR